VPWQLFGYGRSDRSTKLIRGLISETPAGFWSRRGLSYDDSAPVTPHNAPFPTYKTPEFQRQARDFVAAVKAAGKGVELIEAPNYNHYEMGESFGNPYGPSGRAALALMKLPILG
jgi:acetyl esterase/lipase